MCSLRKCELFLCISKCDWGVLHTSNRSGTSIEIKFDSKIKLTHLINVWREWDKERNTRLIHSYHVWCTCVCVCGDGSFCTHIDVQCANDRHALQFVAGWFFLCLSHCFFYGLVFFSSSLTLNIVLFHEIMNELWINAMHLRIERDLKWQSIGNRSDQRLML